MSISEEKKSYADHESAFDQKVWQKRDMYQSLKMAASDAVGSPEKPDFRKTADRFTCKQYRGSNIFEARKKVTVSGEKKESLEENTVPSFDEKGIVVPRTESASVKPEEDESVTSKKKRLSHYEVAEILLESGDWLNDAGLLIHYEANHGYWKLLPKTNENRELRSAVPKEYKPEIDSRYLNELYEWLVLEADTFSENPEARYFINLADVAINWNTGDVITERKKMHFRYYLNATEADLYKESNGEFKSFLKKVFPDDKETLREFKKFCGLALAGIRDQKLSFIFFGPSNTSKTVTLNLLGKMVGSELVSSLSFSQLSSEFAPALLIGKTLNVSGEISGTNNKRLDVFKSLTGNDTMSLCFKNKDYMPSVRLQCMLLFASNVFPVIRDIRELKFFLQRVIIFGFDQVVKRSKWISNYEDILYADRGAVLRVAIEGLRMWQEDSFEIKESKAMLALKKEFLGEFDSFSLFMEECIVIAPKSKLYSHEIGRRYAAYCNREGLVELEGNQWPVILKQSLPVKAVTIETRDPETMEIIRRRGYKGIAFVENEPKPMLIGDKIYGKSGGGSYGK